MQSLIGTVVGGVCCLEANKALDHEDESESNENDIKEPEPIQPTIMDNFDTIKPLPSTTLPSLHNKSVDLLNTNTNTNTNNDYNIFNNIKLSQYGDDSINNLQHVLQTNDYSTGMVGKWHLMTPDDNGHNYECYRVD
eukprot:743538_1